MLPLPRIKAITQQAAGALAYAHSKSIVHRDVKPDNIIVVGEDHVKVTDFGIARILRPDATINTMQSTGMSLGTPHYMAPEQVEGKRVDGRADVYSLGAVLYQMVTGRPPFEGNDPVTIAYKHVHEAPSPPSEIVADVPEDWEGLILKALAKSPQDRFASAGEMEEAIEDLSASPRATGTVVAPRRRVPTPFPRRREPSPPPSAPAEPPPTPPPSPGLGLESLGNQISSLVEAQLANTVSEIKERSQEALEKSRAARRGPAVPAPPVASHPRRLRVLPLSAIMRPWGFFAAAVAVLLIAGVVVWRSQSSSTHTFAFGKQDLSYGLPPPRPAPFGLPRALALDAQGNLYVSDIVSNTLRKLSPTGDPLAVWPAPGSGFKLDTPRGVAVDPQGNVYVADTLDNRVVKLSPAGRLLTFWHAQPGALPGGVATSFSAAESVAVDTHGRVYIVNDLAGRIERYSTTGRFLGQWQAPGLPNPVPSGFTGPQIAADAQGNVWLTDPVNRRVDRLSPSGRLLSSFNAEKGAVPSSQLVSIAVDGRGNVYVADHVDNGVSITSRVQEFSPQGKVIATWGGPNSPGFLYSLRGIAIGPRGSVYVADPDRSTVNELAARGGTLLASWDGTRRQESTTLRHPLGITVDPQGRVYISDPANDTVTSLSLQGQPERAWGTLGSRRAGLSAPWNLALDNGGHIYVADSGNNRIGIFSNRGTLLRAIGTGGSGSRQFQSPFGVAVDSGGSIYVADSGNGRVVKLSPAGKQLAVWQSPGYMGQDQVAVGGNGTVYLADGDSNAIYELSLDLNPFGHWGSYGSDPGRFRAPSGVAVDSSGRVYVADSGNNRIQVFSADGRFLAQLGGLGSGKGQLNDPNGVAVDRQGNLYIADTGNNRVEKFFAGR
jgi:DNA-binding beta-propeller fold protein YncE